MRRAAPTAGLSPQLIKHFAIATVSITALLALIATDAEWGAQAQVEATESRNRLAAAEAEKLGTRKLEAKLKVRDSGGGSMAMGGSSGGGSGGGGSLHPEPPPPAGPRQTDSAQQTEYGRARAGPGGYRAAEQAKPDAKRKPTDEEIEAMLEASRRRSGGGD